MIIGDSSALITLAIVDQLDLLEKLFDELFVPYAVYNEVTKVDKPYGARLGDFLENKVKKVDLKIEKLGLGSGELEAITLYRELDADLLLIDDNRGKKFAVLNGIKVIGSLGVLIKAKESGYIKEVKPLINLIEKSEIYISEKLIDQVLTICDESSQ